jgi:ribonucrease Y
MDNTIIGLLMALIIVCLLATCSYYIRLYKQAVKDAELKKYSEDDLRDISKQFLVKQNDEIAKVKTEVESKLQKEYEDKNQLIVEKLKLSAQQELHEEERKIRQLELEAQARVTQKYTQIDEKEVVLEKDKQYVLSEKEAIENKKQELNQIKDLLISKQKKIDEEIEQKLEQVGSFTAEQAKQYILAKAKDDMGNQLIGLQSKMLADTEDTVNEKAREIVSLAIQRCSSEVANELTVTAVKISNEEEKGKLIGRGGRNIQWLEKTLGVELIIDDTPNIITVSGFSGIRRHIAKRTLEKLLTDGRVHPSAIEEMYEKAKSEIGSEIQMAGEEVVNELGIFDFPPKLVRILGRLKFRTSYGQNILKHSLEMAKLAGLLCDELTTAFPTKLEVDKMTCIKGALLHDIGKAVDEEQIPKGNHIELGEKICDMFDLDWKIKKCISSHHTTGGDYQSYEDAEHGFCFEACIVDACDNISGSRPGARKEAAEAYYGRLEALERIANSVPGVLKSYIMRGSRELWVFFDPETTNLADTHIATREIVRKINSSIKSPFKIQVNAFLENRIVEYAG